MRVIYIILVTTLSFYSYGQSTKVITAIEKLSKEEYRFLSNIGKNSEDKLLLTQDVLRYYRIINGAKENFRNDIIFKKDQDGFIQGEYIYYNLSFSGDEYNFKIDYSYSSGSALIVEGNIMKNGNLIMKTEIFCGTTGCGTTVSLNDNLVYEKLKDFE